MFLSTLIFPFYLFNIKPGTDRSTNFINYWLFIFIYCLYQFGLFYFSLKALFWLELRGACKKIFFEFSPKFFIFKVASLLHVKTFVFVYFKNIFCSF